jgi:hypothetical protein
LRACGVGLRGFAARLAQRVSGLATPLASVSERNKGVCSLLTS